MDCDLSRSSSELQKISSAIHGLICQQRSDFGEPFSAALLHNSELNRIFEAVSKSHCKLDPIDCLQRIYISSAHYHCPCSG